MKKKIIIGFILTILWMIVIYSFSAKTSAELDVKNSFIVTTVAKIIKPNYESLADTELDNFLSTISFFVSKTAHYTEYAILAFFLFYAFAFIKKYGLRYSIIVLISCLYAISDEFHQKFSSGRTPRIQDVMIDTLGAITAVLFIEFILTIHRMRGNKKWLIHIHIFLKKNLIAI